MELQDNQPHGCPHWLVTPFQGQKRSVKSGIFKEASVLQSSGPSRLSPSMSDKPSRIDTEGVKAI